mgnify:CR=1 FL=1
MSKLMQSLALAAAAFAVLTAGCAKKQDETAKRLEETQKQLEEAKQQLAAAQGQAAESAANPRAAGTPAPPAPAAPVAPKPSPAAGDKAGSGASAWSSKEAAPPQTAAKPAATEPPKPKVHTLEAGTPISVRTVGAVSTKTSSVGEKFEATLAEPLIADGYVIAPKGARVEGVVTSSDPGGRVKGVATISVGLRSIVMADGRLLEIKTGSVSREAKESKGKDAMKVGIASGVGAAIGAIAGGGKGAAIGAGAGAAGGTGVVLATRGDPAVIPAESVLSFKLTAPVTVQESK